MVALVNSEPPFLYFGIREGSMTQPNSDASLCYNKSKMHEEPAYACP
jgi:hypothetical protein